MKDKSLTFTERSGVKYHRFNLEAIIERLKYNEEIARKFHEIEKTILSILDFKDFFKVLLSEIKRHFNVPFVWISIVEGSEIAHRIEVLEDSMISEESMNMVDKSAFLTLVKNRMKPLLLNANLNICGNLLPQKKQHLIQSIAISPITLNGKIIGSLNQGSDTRERFMPGLDTELLEQLAVKVSICLANVISHEKLKFLAYHDSLTGLLNRRVMTEVLKREFARAKRYIHPLSVAFLDLDYFKIINDTHGHETGDRVLKYVAETLFRMTRETDVVARFAGDEFVVILPETEADKAMGLIDRVKSHLHENHFQYHDTTIEVSTSFGIASTEDKKLKTPEALLTAADEKLYTHKKSRR